MKTKIAAISVLLLGTLATLPSANAIFAPAACTPPGPGTYTCAGSEVYDCANPPCTNHTEGTTIVGCTIYSGTEDWKDTDKVTNGTHSWDYRVISYCSGQEILCRLTNSVNLDMGSAYTLRHLATVVNADASTDNSVLAYSTDSDAKPATMTVNCRVSRQG